MVAQYPDWVSRQEFLILPWWLLRRMPTIDECHV